MITQCGRRMKFTRKTAPATCLHFHSRVNKSQSVRKHKSDATNNLLTAGHACLRTVFNVLRVVVSSFKIPISASLDSDQH
jgi:hypothetical protein